MRHSIEWRDEASNASPEERATVGDLRLSIGNHNATRHLLNDRVVDHVTVALYGLAHGLAHDWWSIFGARDRDFSLRSYRSGFLLPDVRMRFDGGVFEISAHQSTYSDPDFRFWAGSSEALTREEGEGCLASLIDDVVDRLDSQGIRETGAALRWRRVQASRSSPERFFCEAAGSLGLDPYQIPDDAAAFIEQAEGVFDAEPLIEFVSGAAKVDRSQLLDWVLDATGVDEPRYRLAHLRPLADQIAADFPVRPDERAWAEGYRRARAVRSALGLGQHDRISSFEDLARILGAGAAFDLAPSVDGISALRHEGAGGISIHLRNHGRLAGAGATHLFALARAIGDAVCFPEPATAPINNLRRAYRQSASRAFAAEFLAPVDEILSMLADERDEYSIADELSVAPTVIERQIENRDRIASVCEP